MNKRIVSAIVLAGMITSSSAFASKARQQVMGTGGADVVSGLGSFYYDHAYNFFYNPAYINDYKNWLIVEKDTAGQASFGFVSSMMNFNMGLFFNRDGGVYTPAANSPTFAATTSRPVDLIIGGDAGVKWGLGLQYTQDKAASATAGQTDKTSELNVRLGASFSGLDPWLSYRVIGKTEIGGTEVAEASGFGAGLRYHFGEWVPYAQYKTDEAKVKASGDKDETTIYTVGVGRETKIAEGARLVYALYYQNTDTDFTVGGAKSENSGNILPIEMAVEADVLAWLTVRGGVNHALIGTGAKTTTGRIGGTFHIAKVDLDYAFGNMVNGAGTVTNDSPDVGFDSGTFHQIAMRYSW